MSPGPLRQTLRLSVGLLALLWWLPAAAQPGSGGVKVAPPHVVASGAPIAPEVAVAAAVVGGIPVPIPAPITAGADGGGALPAATTPTTRQPASRLAAATTATKHPAASKRDGLINRLVKKGLGGVDATASDDRERELKRQQEQRDALDLEARNAAYEADDAAAAASAAALAHKRALAAAQRARSAAQRAVATERARIEKAKLDLAHVRRKLADRRKAASVLARKRFERFGGLKKQARAQLPAAKVDALYLVLVKALHDIRDQMTSDLSELDGEALASAVGAGESTDKRLSLATPSQRQRLVLALGATRAERGNLVALDHDQRLADCAATADHLREMNELRTSLIDRLSASARRELFGLTGAGLAQLRRELRHVELLARWYPTSRIRIVELPRSVDEVILKLSSITLSLLKAVFLLFAWWLVRRQWRRWVADARVLVAPRVARSLTWRSIDIALVLVLNLGRELAWLLATLIVFNWVLDASVATELKLVYEMSLIWATYRLVLAMTHRFFTSAARLRLRTRQVDVSSELSARILSSVRLVARYVLIVWIALTLAGHLVGRGYIYLLVERFAWFGALPIAFMLVQRWHAGISDAYLRVYPEGGLARAVRSTQAKPVGLLVAFAAFAYVALRGVALSIGDVAMSFDGTRRVLAYLFRRELERRADEIRVTTSIEALPSPVQMAFADRPAPTEDLVGALPELDEVHSDVQAWASGGPSSAVAITGSWGCGKTTWLNALAREVSADKACEICLVNLTIAQRPTDLAELYHSLAVQLGRPEADSYDALVDLLQDGQKRLILLDNAGRLVLRAMGGAGLWVALSGLIGATRRDTFWVVAASQHATYLANKMLPKRDTYDRVVRFQPWTEEQIGSLIGQRMESCGAEANFEDLWETIDDSQDTFVEGMRAGERFMRMLWDHTDGNPRDALYFWLRSLVPDEGALVRVHLFEARTADGLEHLRELSRFCLRAVLVHGSLSADEVVRVLYEDKEEVFTTLGWLAERGILAPVAEHSETNAQRWEVSPAWHRAAVRYLKRKHLISE